MRVHTAQFTFADLMSLCKEEYHRFDMNAPEVIDAKLNHTLDGEYREMTVVVFPF